MDWTKLAHKKLHKSFIESRNSPILSTTELSSRLLHEASKNQLLSRRFEDHGKFYRKWIGIQKFNLFTLG
ncbi:hypothetical protein HZF08_14155 [Paenibacillus sp. CGMCC 1.16610]|uniref:Uncharacterized protein n=1 Tax=Paenibacillus anseongense TaxID=2682845 RepID=A0ABW9UK98_9BACL|nr:MULTISPECIES: hypothetical protein [Paenibacillus]MBA2939454.1 hypothetical protein [Paenibacillus sp. CGMCC 1.16610]MVQ39118.1 hypothetical protein [Paenibacillus anseongense]